MDQTSSQFDDHDDYLWSGRGDAPADVRRLEAVLSTLRSQRPAPDAADIAPRADLPAHAPWRTWAVAATLALAIAAPWMASRVVPAATHWTVAWTDGASAPGQTRLRVGASLDTGLRQARLAVGDIGTVDLAPGTRVRLVDAGAARHRLALERGRMHAVIWAPPGQFLVDTPSAVAVDLGCQYTLEVTENGAGVLHVTVGWVGFAHQGRRVLVPAGAMASTRPGTGPGTPYLDDASRGVIAALEVIDFGGDRGEARAAALAEVLAAAREADALTLWHLLARVDARERGLVFDRFAHLVPPPPGVSRAGIVGGDQRMLDAWWNVLGLGDAADWREWTSPWSSETPGGTR